MHEAPADLEVDEPAPVLLVEDSPMISRSLTDLLEDGGRCKVVRVVDTESAATEFLAQDRCRIAVIDLQLREGNGLGVLRFLRGLSDRPLTIVLTNYARPEVAAQCRALGADHFFDKSREFLEVMPAIEAFLDSRAEP